MKKFFATLCVVALIFSLAACGKKDKNNKTTPTPTATEAPTATPTEAPTATPTVTPDAPGAKSEGVMTYAEYVAAADDDEIVIECYVQNHQSWWDNKISVYAADEDGAYFLYNMTCSEEDAAKLVPGTKIKVTGYKASWAGEVEVAEGATFEFEEGSYFSSATDVTDLLGKDELINKQNQFVSFKGLTVESAALYKWDGSGAQGDDLYFDVSLNGERYTFTVESYLCDKDSDVYKAVELLKVGDVVDLTGFLYWYNGVNPHITSCKVTANVNEKAEGVMSYADYVKAADDDEVVIECYVQNHQSWWDNKISVYAADKDGAYFLYNLTCSEEDAAKLVPGTKIKVTGYKTSWSGEVEVAEGATFEFEDGSYIAPVTDVTALLGKNELIDMQNQYVSFKGMTVAKAALYKWDGSGAQGDDLYFDVTLGDATYTFTVESYLCGKDTDVYKAVEALQVGDVIDLEGFLYWYNGVNPHITKVTPAK